MTMSIRKGNVSHVSFIFEEILRICDDFMKVGVNVVVGGDNIV